MGATENIPALMYTILTEFKIALHGDGEPIGCPLAEW